MDKPLTDAELDGFIRQCATNPVSAKRVVAELRALREQNAELLAERDEAVCIALDNAAARDTTLEQNAKLVAALEVFADDQHGGDVWGRYCADVHDLARAALTSVKGEQG